MSNDKPIFEQDLETFMVEHRQEISDFVSSVIGVPENFLGLVAARLIAMSASQNPTFVILHRLGFNVDNVIDMLTVAVLLGIYAERQGWTIDTRDLDLSAFEE